MKTAKNENVVFIGEVWKQNNNKYRVNAWAVKIWRRLPYMEWVVRGIESAIFFFNKFYWKKLSKYILTQMKAIESLFY